MPKKAKKGGGGKGGGRTEEERLLILQQRAQAEEEMAKKKEEILTLFLKDKLQKEEKNTAVNLLKLNEGWRSVLRQTRAAELRTDIAVLSQTFERQLDGLDSVIKNLERDLRGAERQSAQVRRVHLQHVERLWAEQDKRLMLLQQQWEQSLQHLSSRFNCERRQLLAQAQQQNTVLEDVAFAVEQQHREVMQEIHRLYSESLASCESAHGDRVVSLVQDSRKKLNEKSLQNQEILQLCSKETQELDRLVSKNQNYIQMTAKAVKNVKVLQDSVVQLRVMLNYKKTENQSVEQDLTAGIDEMNKKTHKLRDQLTQGQSAARKRLIDLTVQSSAAAKKLQAVITKGQRVLRVAEMCRKLESEQENVFTSLSPAAENQRSEPGQEEVAKDAEFPELRRVTRRINAALLWRAALKKQREDLSRENRQLRLLLRQHLDAMTLSDHALDRHRALLTVHRAPTTTVPPDTDRHHTVIEAVHAAKQSL